MASYRRARITGVVREAGASRLNASTPHAWSTERLVAEAEGQIDAGVSGGPPAPAWTADPSDWWRTQEVNVLGALHAVHPSSPGWWRADAAG